MGSSVGVASTPNVSDLVCGDPGCLDCMLTQKNRTVLSCLSGLMSHIPLYINPFAVRPCIAPSVSASSSGCQSGLRSGMFSSIHAALTTLPSLVCGFGPDCINGIHLC